MILLKYLNCLNQVKKKFSTNDSLRNSYYCIAHLSSLEHKNKDAEVFFSALCANCANKRRHKDVDGQQRLQPKLFK